MSDEPFRSSLEEGALRQSIGTNGTAVARLDATGSIKQPLQLEDEATRKALRKMPDIGDIGAISRQFDELSRQLYGPSAIMQQFRQQQDEVKRMALPTMPDIGRIAAIGRQFDKLSRQLEASSAIMQRFRVQQNAQIQWLAKLADVGGIGAELGKRFRFESRVFEANRFGLSDRLVEIGATFREAMDSQRSCEGLFRLPEPIELHGLAHGAMERINASMRAMLETEASLQSAMATMRSPWLQIDTGLASAKAFADLLTLGRGLTGLPAFDRTFTAAVREGLGDWRDPLMPAMESLLNPVVRVEFYVQRGFDTDLTDFPRAAFDESLRITGLRDSESTEADVDPKRDYSRARDAYDRLLRFEIAIRRYIERVMLEAFGQGWTKSRLPADLLERWVQKRDSAVKSGQPALALIDYADFTDYWKVIERKDNWNAIFKPVFGRLEDVRESFQRLYPVRVATMHARFLTPDDELLLLIETRRVLKAIELY